MGPRLWALSILTALLVPLHTANSDTPLDAVTVDGIVEVVRENGLDGCELCEACSDCRAVHVLLRSNGGHREIHLAPAWFLDRLELRPRTGDVMHVVGTRIRLPEGRGIAAHEVRVGATRFLLRDEHGLPLWRRLLTDAEEAAGAETGAATAQVRPQALVTLLPPA